ncbi:cuticle protein 16.8 [Nephila pilipes]|uniref:Cuticle protein 16.8 n=1 Tax=Nephila pilipes TaxID=299642 RepID=A0A8X6TI23_NEPPI|nr:cuticle protein 16.8 [Nephila pilipes]
MALKASLIIAFAAVAAAYPFVPIEEGLHKPHPYTFGYKIKDKHGEQHREETGDGVGVVKGSYGFTDERGIKRQVHYVADKAGFRAEIKTNEHGTAPLDPAAVKMDSSAHPYFGGAGAKAVLGGPALTGLAIEPAAVHAIPFVAGPLPFVESAAYAAPLPFAEHAAYAAPLHGGEIKGFDSRFGSY